MKAIEVTCPVCHAPPGTDCLTYSKGPGMQPSKVPHTARLEAAEEDPIIAAARALPAVQPIDERTVLLSHLGALASVGNRIATALENLVLHAGVTGGALDELVGKVRLVRPSKVKRKRRKGARRRVLKSAKWVTP